MEFLSFNATSALYFFLSALILSPIPKKGSILFR